MKISSITFLFGIVLAFIFDIMGIGLMSVGILLGVLIGLMIMNDWNKDEKIDEFIEELKEFRPKYKNWDRNSIIRLCILEKINKEEVQE